MNIPDQDTRIVFLNGEYIEKNKAFISPDDRGFMFADGVYEVVRIYGGRPFELDEHIRRLSLSLEGLRIKGADPESFRDIIPNLLNMNSLTSSGALVYIQITRGAAPRTHAFPSGLISPTLYAAADPYDSPARLQESGIPIILLPDSRWDRCNIKSVFLLPNVLAKQKAEEAGAGEAVFVRDDVLTEGSASNFAAVFAGTLVTHPEGGHILSGITRKVALSLCRRLEIPFEERPVKKGELPYAEEMMVMSTTKEIMPVISYGSDTVGDGKPGPVTRRLQEAFNKEIHG